MSLPRIIDRGFTLSSRRVLSIGEELETYQSLGLVNSAHHKVFQERVRIHINVGDARSCDQVIGINALEYDIFRLG